jgi:hypothetical protein
LANNTISEVRYNLKNFHENLRNLPTFAKSVKFGKLLREINEVIVDLREGENNFTWKDMARIRQVTKLDPTQLEKISEGKF